MNDLRHGDEIDVVVVGEDFIDPVEESFEEFRVVFEPCGVEVQAQRCAVLIVVTLEVVVEESVELIA